MPVMTSGAAQRTGAGSAGNISVNLSDSEQAGGAGLGEPLSIEFANTLAAAHGRVRDGLSHPAGLTAWLTEHRGRLGLEPGDIAAIDPAGQLEQFVTLRNAIRSLVHAVTEGAAPAAADLDVINDAAAAAPRWPALLPREPGQLGIVEQSSGAPEAAGLALIARDAITLLGGYFRDDLRACKAPGCARFFVKDHPRREWCSAACGNRARAARHYRRRHDASPG
jgi:predicted RNA-binding Zn ribbon-like protein